MPMQPNEEIKIVPQAQGDLDLAKAGKTFVTSAILAGTGITSQDSMEATLTSKNWQNTVVVSTSM
ncbi:hypothetical protein HPB48_006630 [Haemaphysalis longicornis]|uniref:Uncharacterized protein n=1 Tax=Haemaphysalis longicornis TaxID=44386 RepID=A0A9J6GU07_HAELO|nr:hypothetical protein HPB48_006630 [Haemaphysalis longicornis]